MATQTVGARSSAAIWKNETTSDPGSTDDSSAGYEIGSLWFNTSSGDVFICVDATASSASWQLIFDAA